MGVVPKECPTFQSKTKLRCMQMHANKYGYVPSSDIPGHRLVDVLFPARLQKEVILVRAGSSAFLVQNPEIDEQDQHMGSGCSSASVLKLQKKRQVPLKS